MPAEVGQKELDTSVSPDEFKRLKRIANIAYFAAKNDISFRKFPNLVELVNREGNLNFEKDIGTLYVNKDGCREFIKAHGEVSIQNVAEVVSKSNFFSILMDGSTIHGKEKEGVYIQSFQREEFIKGGNPTVTQLLNLPDVQGVSANADELKACVDRSFDLIKEPCGSDNMLKKIISICTDGASTNIGCNDSLFTRLVEEHPHLIPFWCIVHQLELAIKECVGTGLLNDIKECLLKLYHLYNKSTKKLRSLKELISELDSLVELTDNFIEDDGVAPIKACGTRWIGHLVNALQRAINKFGIYLTDLEDFAKKEKKASKKAELLGFVSRWRDYRYLLGMGLFLHLLMPLKELSLGWQKKIVTAVDQERRLEKALTDLAIVKRICESGKVFELPYVKTLLQNTTDDGCFQNFEFNYVDRAKSTICNNAVIWVDKVIECVKSRFEDDSHKDIIRAAYKVLNSWTVMEASPKETVAGSESDTADETDDSCSQSDDDDEDDVNSAEECAEEETFLFTAVDSSIDLLTKQFEKPLLNADVQISSLKMEYKSLQDYVKEHYKTENMDYVAIWRSIFQLEAVGVTEYSNILKLAELCLTFAVANAKSETGFSHMKRVETNYRSQLSETSLSSIMRMVMDGKPYMEYDSTAAVEVFLQQKNRKRTYDVEERKRSADKAVDEGSTSKKVKKYHTVQKTLFDLAK